MRIPYKWLKDYVHVDLAPEPLAERLTLAGLEVDRVEYPWPGIIVGQIIWQERVKGSDHLWATRVTTGREELSVVCGAPNIQPLDKVPLALVGAKVGEITIAEKNAMGVLSQGMLCSPRELGISDDHEGIYILPKDALIGEPLGKLLGDAVIDLDIKAHRGDLFCVVGVARAVAGWSVGRARCDREGNTGAASGRGLDAEVAAECGGALAEQEESEACVRAGGGGVEAAAVVGDTEDESLG